MKDGVVPKLKVQNLTYFPFPARRFGATGEEGGGCSAKALAFAFAFALELAVAFGAPLIFGLGNGMDFALDSIVIDDCTLSGWLKNEWTLILG